MMTVLFFVLRTAAAQCEPERCEAVRRTSLLSECCNATDPANGERWPLLVTGTPRSGTTYVTWALKGFDLKLHHDWDSRGPGRDGLVSWMHIFRADRYFGPCNLDGGRFRAAVVVVRDPLVSITSIACSTDMREQAYFDFVASHVKLEQRSREYQALQFFVEWQDFLQRLGLFTFRVEDTNASIPKILALAGEPAPQPHQYHKAKWLMDRVNDGGSVSINSRGDHRPPFTWAELAAIDTGYANRAMAFCRTYGYCAQDQQLPQPAPELPTCECGKFYCNEDSKTGHVHSRRL